MHNFKVNFFRSTPCICAILCSGNDVAVWISWFMTVGCLWMSYIALSYFYACTLKFFVMNYRVNVAVCCMLLVTNGAAAVMLLRLQLIDVYCSKLRL